MAHLFGLTPDYFLAGPYWRWVRFKDWADDYQSKQQQAGAEG
jgi:hypothetical protein